MDNIRSKAYETFHTLLDCEGTEQLAAAYDHLASDYDMLSDALGWVGPAQTTKKVLAVEPNKNARILDVGCGTGMVGSALWEAGYRNLYGVDLSEKLLHIASEKGVYSNQLIHASFGPDTPLTFENGYFDLAVSAGCFVPGHLDESHLPEMIRLVKRDGHLIIITRKAVFENEEGDMKLKSCLHHLVKENVLKKILHEDIPYRTDRNMMGVALCYQVI